MNKTVLSIESTCDLPKALIEKYNLSLINMEYNVDGKNYVMGDGSHTMKAFYDCMRRGSLTGTSQVNEFNAKEHLKKILSSGNDVIHLAFSSSLSGTCDNFKKAAEELKQEYPDRNIAVVDSLSACAGQGIFAVYVAEFLQNNGFEETVRFAEELKQKIFLLFTVDNLKYLARGGRVSKTTALLGNAIHMKPVMHMNSEGKLVPFKKVISRKKSLLELIDNTVEQFDRKTDKIYIAHADCFEDATYVKEHLYKELGVTAEIMELGMVIGSHSGPGTLAVFFKGEARENIK